VSEIGSYRFTPGKISATLMEDYSNAVLPRSPAIAVNA
jgi:hypothetical protein